MESAEGFTGGSTARSKETRKGGLTRHRFDPEHLGHRRVVRKVGDPRKLVGSAQNAADKTQCGVRRIISVRAGRCVWQRLAQLLAQARLRHIPTPYRQAAVGRQALIGEANPHRLHALFCAQIQPHRLVRLRLRR